MKQAFRRGLLAGVLGPLAFIAALIYWVYRATGRVPFPVRRLGHEEIALGLVPPSQVSVYWRPWRQELEPLLEALRAAVAGLLSWVGRR